MSGVLPSRPRVPRCQNILNFENPSFLADFITVLVNTTISELNQFFFQTSVAMTRTISQPVRAKILGFLELGWSCGRVAKHLGVSKSGVWKLGHRAREEGEAVALKGKKVQCGRKKIVRQQDKDWIVRQAMKQKIEEKQPSSLQDLINKIKQVWCLETSSEVCKKLVRSMPGSLQKVLDNDGWSIGY